MSNMNGVNEKKRSRRRDLGDDDAPVKQVLMSTSTYIPSILRPTHSANNLHIFLQVSIKTNPFNVRGTFRTNMTSKSSFY